MGDIGNPISFNGWTLAWQHGRQLASMSKAGRTLNFYYDAGGLRTRKDDNVEGTTDYTLHGKLITHLKKGNNNLHFFYDAQSRPAMVDFNGTIYTYAHNLQGDIVAILDGNNTKVVEYKYDAWGKPFTPTGSLSTTLGKLNPFRYRGYVWDDETGLYYLRSRCYNPEWGRFLNADAYIGKKRLMQHNLYAYCLNNPIVNHDTNGNIVTPIPTLSPRNPIPVPLPSRPSNWEYLFYMASIRGPMFGPPNSHWRWLSGNGKWYERWMGEDGTPKLDRHWTNHGNPNKHPDVPHDEDWIPDRKGGKVLDSGHPRPSPEDAEEPEDANWPLPESNENDIADKIVSGIEVAVGGYVLHKILVLGVATFVAPYTGGTSYYFASLM